MIGKRDYAPDSASDHDAYSLAVLRSDLDIGMFNSLKGCGGPQLGETVHSPGLFPAQVRLRVETLYFRREGRLKPFGVEGSDMVDPRFTGEQALPRRLPIQADGTDHPYARNDYAIHVRTHLSVHFTAPSNQYEAELIYQKAENGCCIIARQIRE